jgi:hypothetical protein
MDDPRERDTLAYYPYVTVRIGCALCRREGVYRLARLAATYGSEIALPELLARLTRQCPHHSQGGGCAARFTDLDPPMPPPDLPRSTKKLRVIKGGRKEDNESPCADASSRNRDRSNSRS